MTQLEAARKGIIAPEMIRGAIRGNVSAEFIRHGVARRTVARTRQAASLLLVVGLLGAWPTLAQETAKRPAAGMGTHDMPLDAYNGKYKDFAPFKKIAARLGDNSAQARRRRTRQTPDADLETARPTAQAVISASTATRNRYDLRS